MELIEIYTSFRMRFGTNKVQIIRLQTHIIEVNEAILYGYQILLTSPKRRPWKIVPW